MGSNKVLPQITTTIGSENNLFAIVLSEEVAKGKGVIVNSSWDAIWQAMSKRLTLDNFIPPNHLSLLISYALEIKQDARLFSQDIGSVVIMDGGCGGINRVPQYILKYQEAINEQASASSGVEEGADLGLCLTGDKAGLQDNYSIRQNP